MRNLNAKIGKKDREELVELLRKSASNKAFFEDLFSDLFTPAELAEVTARLQIVKQLAEGITQRDVCEHLHVGLGTVTRGARILEKGTGALAKVTGYDRTKGSN